MRNNAMGESYDLEEAASSFEEKEEEEEEEEKEEQDRHKYANMLYLNTCSSSFFCIA